MKSRTESPSENTVGDLSLQLDLLTSHSGGGEPQSACLSAASLSSQDEAALKKKAVVQF